MKNRPTLAFYWCSSCGGCEESIVDLAEDLLTIINAVQFVFFPCAMDFKRKDVEKLPDESISVCFINGTIRNTENEEMVHLLRQKSQLIIAFGACAHLGGIPSLANNCDIDEIMAYVYKKIPSVHNPENVFPQSITEIQGKTVTLPSMHNVARSLDQVIRVDYYLPGCPPTPKIVKEAITSILDGTLPAPGTILAPDITLCEQCPRLDSKPDDLVIERFMRPHQIIIDENICLLAQGLVCLGPATRGGCEALCIQGNMPCTGCFGPVSRVIDHGAKILSFLCSVARGREEKEIITSLKGIPDPVGTFYKYGLAKSLFRGKIHCGKKTIVGDDNHE